MRLHEVFPRQRCLSVAAVTLLATTLGCGGKGDVSGNVTLDGQPLPGGTITFTPAQGSAVSAEIKDGQYTAKKVPSGQAKVTVDTSTLKTQADQIANSAQQNRGLNAGAQGGNLPPGAKEAIEKEIKANEERTKQAKELYDKYRPIPQKYSKADTSGLTLDVKSGSQTFDVPLVSK